MWCCCQVSGGPCLPGPAAGSAECAPRLARAHAPLSVSPRGCDGVWSCQSSCQASCAGVSVALARGQPVACKPRGRPAPRRGVVLSTTTRTRAALCGTSNRPATASGAAQRRPAAAASCACTDRWHLAPAYPFWGPAGAQVGHARVLATWIDSTSWIDSMEYHLGHVPPTEPLVGRWGCRPGHAATHLEVSSSQALAPGAARLLCSPSHAAAGGCAGGRRLAAWRRAAPRPARRAARCVRHPRGPRAPRPAGRPERPPAAAAASAWPCRSGCWPAAWRGPCRAPLWRPWSGYEQ